jgi:4-alpha-glucanotransferase
MVFPKGQRYYSGMSIPLFALRTSESTGCGDFLDLKAMGRFAKSCGFDLVQLLPVNDTGMNSSPYSNVSSMALNPIYLRLNRVSYGRDVPDLIAELRKNLETPGRGKYREVYAGKLSVLRQSIEETSMHFSLMIQYQPGLHPMAGCRPTLYIRF